uniref:Uncharacterized protein n=1 Tax=Octopus bimaculoides TaxID=37653 RepID=A0A0L8HT39_OCTBM
MCNICTCIYMYVCVWEKHREMVSLLKANVRFKRIEGQISIFWWMMKWVWLKNLSKISINNQRCCLVLLPANWRGI